MNRVIRELDKLIEEKFLSANEIFIQRGDSQRSKYAPCQEYMEESIFNGYLQKSEILITHGGTSSIIKGLRAQKRIIVIPRRKKYGEHVDDHQLQIAQLFEQKKYLLVLNNIDNLKQAIVKIRSMTMPTIHLDGSLAKFIAESFINKL